MNLIDTPEEKKKTRNKQEKTRVITEDSSFPTKHYCNLYFNITAQIKMAFHNLNNGKSSHENNNQHDTKKAGWLAGWWQALACQQLHKGVPAAIRRLMQAAVGGCCQSAAGSLRLLTSH